MNLKIIKLIIRKIIGTKLNAAYIFGSFLNDPENANDIDILIRVSHNINKIENYLLKVLLSKYRPRILHNRYDGLNQNKNHDIDLLIVDNESDFGNILRLNKTLRII